MKSIKSIWEEAIRTWLINKELAKESEAMELAEKIVERHFIK